MRALFISLRALSLLVLLASVARAELSIQDIRDSAAALRSPAVAGLQAASPGVLFEETSSGIRTVFGRSFGSGTSAEAAAEQFRRQYAGVFGVAVDDLQPRSFLPDERHVQPLMYDAATGAYKFSLVCFRQERSAVPVFRSEMRVLVRNEPGFPVVLARSSLRPLGLFVLNRAEALQPERARAAALQDSPGLKTFTAAREVIWAGVEDMEVIPRRAVQFVAHGGDAASPDGYEEWLFVADATTGEILYKENQVLHVDVSGTVTAVATELVGADICRDEVPMPMPYAAVNIQGQGTFYTDVNGNYTLPNAGFDDVVVESRVTGLRFAITDNAASTPVLSQNVLPPGPGDFTHNSANTSEFLRASVNAYVQANAIRDLVVSVNPAYPTIGTQTGMGVNVNIDQNCNAFYSPAGQTINFYRAGGGCSNTANGDVVHHEYGHHVVQMGGSGQGQYGEGMGDCMGVLMSDQPVLGIGFQNNCAAGIRTALNTMQYPCSGAIHTCGQLLSGCVWDTRNLLIQTNPGTYRQILADLTINSVPLHVVSSTITPQIANDFLTLDDDDANLANGTPHCYEIKGGFSVHNMAPTGLGTATSFAYPNGRPALVPVNQTSTIRVNVVPGVCPVPAPGTGVVSYRIGTSGPFTTVPMAQLAAHEYEATLPAAPCRSTIQYYFSAGGSPTGSISDPPNSPTSLFYTTVASGVNTLVAYDFQTDPAWTVSGTVTDGAWDAAPGVPVNCSRGDPNADFNGGGGRCWMTDNSAANSCNSDVDGGSTTLTSEIFDISGMDEPQVSYARWYSNTAGSAPQADVFVVEVSSDGGTNWVNLETVGPTTSSPNPEVSGGWFLKSFRIEDFVPLTNQFRIRFTAADAGSGSVIEAAIDAFSVTDLVCPPPCPAATGDINADTFVDSSDVQVFTSAMLGAPTQAELCAGDFSGNLLLDPADIDGFVNVLLQP
jgi:hypothetical protein